MSEILTVTEDDQAIIQNIWNASELIYSEAQKLGASLAKNESFKRRYGDPPQYEAVKKDQELRAFLSSKINLCLPGDIKNSNYGVVIGK